MKTVRSSLLLLLALLLAATPVFGAAKYRITEIVTGVTLSNPNWFGQLVSINNQGVTAGW